jgi:HK97 family phage prohead protease
MDANIERRYLPSDEAAIELRAGDSPRIRGLAAAFGKPSLDLGGFREIIQPGAFDKVLSRRKLDVVALFDHEGQPLGRTLSGTLALSVDERGLNYEIDPPDTQLGRDVMTLLRRGDLFQSSFAFTVEPKGEEWNVDERGNTTRTIREFSGLYDVSVVTHAAYGNATNAAVRSLEKWRAEHMPAAPEAEPVAAVKRSLAGAKAAAAAAVARMRAHAG